MIRSSYAPLVRNHHRKPRRRMGRSPSAIAAFCGTRPRISRSQGAAMLLKEPMTVRRECQSYVTESIPWRRPPGGSTLSAVKNYSADNDAGLLRYLNRVFRPEDPVLKEARERSLKAG